MILVGHAYFLRFDPKLWDAMQPYTPLGTLYAAAAIRARGHEVAVFDAMLAASEEDWAAALDRHQPRLAVLCEDSFNYLSKMCLLRMREAALGMIGMARARGCATVVAGTDATDHPEIYLEGGAIAVVAGEGELTLGDVADAWARDAQPALAEIAGLWLPGSQGPVATAPRERVRDLDSLPAPAWDLIDLDQYRRIWTTRHGHFSINLVTTRGCPYHCNWCARPVYGQRYVVRSPERVVEDIVSLRTRGPVNHVDHINFVDDIFGLKPGWIARFADLMEAAGPLPFRCLLRADLITPAIVSSLARAGCHTVWIGAESGSQRVLDAMEKGITVGQIENATAMLKAAQIGVGWFLQFGYPGEGRADIDLTRALLRRGRPDDIGVSVSYPLPGTKFYESVSAQLGAERNWRDSSDLAMLYRGPFSTAFYRQLHRVVHLEFRAERPASGAVAVAKRAFAALRLPWERLRLEMLEWSSDRRSRRASARQAVRRAESPPPTTVTHSDLVQTAREQEP